MILSRGRNYIFVHIPKTGGTAMALALESRAMKEDIMLGDTPKARKRRHRLRDVAARGRLWKHATLADIEGLIAPGEAESMFVFTLVRNPWDRLVSYYHWLREQSFDHVAVKLSQAHDFASFLRQPEIARSFQTRPYASYVCDAAGTERANLFIRLEHFETDAAPLWDHLGFRLDLPHANQSARRRDYRHYYCDESAGHVAQFCADDIARFGYSFN